MSTYGPSYFMLNTEILTWCEKPLHCLATNTSPLVLPQAKVPMVLGDYTLFPKGTNLIPWAFLFRKLYPTSPTSFPFPPGSIHCVMAVAKVLFPIPSLQQRKLPLYISCSSLHSPDSLATSMDHSNSSGQSEQK